MLGNYLQQTTSADNIFRCIFFLGALRIKEAPGCFVHGLKICMWFGLIFGLPEPLVHGELL